MASPVIRRLGIAIFLGVAAQFPAVQAVRLDWVISGASAEVVASPNAPAHASAESSSATEGPPRALKGEEIRPDLGKSQASEPKREEDLLPMFPAKAPERRKDGKPSFQIRCWQRGVLLFGENDVSEATANDFLERAARRGGKPFEKLAPGQIQVVDFQETLCMIKRRS